MFVGDDDLVQIVRLLDQTLNSIDGVTVREATEALDRLSTELPHFPYRLLSIASGGENPSQRVAAATYLKNFTRRSTGIEGTISEVSKEFKDELLQALLKAEPAVLKVLLELLHVVVVSEFVKKNAWPDLVPEMRSAIEKSNLISSSDFSWSTVNALLVLLTVVKPFQYFLQPKLAKEPVPQQLEIITKEILVPLVSVFHRLVDKALTTHGWGELELEKTLHIICKCLYFSVKSHMPSALSPLLGSFCRDMIRILDSLSFEWSAITPSDGYLIRSKAGKRSLLLFGTLVSSHRKYSDKLVPEIVNCSVKIVKHSSNISKLGCLSERIISLAFDVISRVMEIGPDISEWEEDADEFIRKNLPSELEEISGWREDLFTARKSAMNLLGVLAMSKALLHSSHMYHEAKHVFANHGVKVSSVEVDLPAMLAQKDNAVKNLTRGVEGLFKKNKVNYVKGYGKFLSPNEVSVDTIEGGNTVVKGKHIIVATGSDVKSLPGITIDEKKIVSSTGALSLTEIPKKLIVIGAGYIGLEMGSVWGRLGSEVTVVEFAADIVPSMDGEICKQFQRSLEKQKMKFMLKTKVVGVDSSGDGVKLIVEPAEGGNQTTLEADVVLVSAGRTPFTSGLDLEKIGVETDKGGRILVNERFSTNVSGVYAIGDVIPGPMLAHKAEEDGVACVEFIAGKHGHVDYDKVPGVVYTYPEVASVGKTEEQLKKDGVSYNVGKFPLMANSRAKAIDTAEGMVKILADKETDKILGVHIMSPNAGELIHEAVLAINYDASSEDIARVCHAHPTMSEAIKEAAMATYDKPIHM